MVFHRSLKYISISQQAKTKPEQLVSNLGGYLGLFVGLSFISLFEIIEIIIEVAFILSGKHNLIEPEIKPEMDTILKLESEIKENNEKINKLTRLYVCNQFQRI